MRTWTLPSQGNVHLSLPGLDNERDIAFRKGKCWMLIIWTDIGLGVLLP